MNDTNKAESSIRKLLQHLLKIPSITATSAHTNKSAQSKKLIVKIATRKVLSDGKFSAEQLEYEMKSYLESSEPENLTNIGFITLFEETTWSELDDAISKVFTVYNFVLLDQMMFHLNFT